MDTKYKSISISHHRDSMLIWTVSKLVSFMFFKYFILIYNQEKVEDPSGMLPREYCIQNLIESRRTNFFTSTAPRLLNCICISRIVKVSTTSVLHQCSSKLITRILSDEIATGIASEDGQWNLQL